MNQYRKKPYYRKRNFNNGNRTNRRFKDTFHQPQAGDSINTPYSRHTLTKGDVEAVVEAMLSGTLTQGKELERFEGLLAKLTHCHYALAVNSGTAAIHSVLAAIGLEPGDEVITSTLNFCAVANMVKLMGAVPVLVDCDPDTLTISVEETRKAVSPKTKAVFANNFGGHVADMSALREICDEHHLVLLEDACHGLGGRYKGHYTGNQADLTCFSFHPSKAITSAEGGAVTTNDVDRFAFMKMFRHHGIQKDPDYFQCDEFNADFYQEVHHVGMNYRMNELQAALGRNQLTRLDRHIERRRAIAQVYNKSLADTKSVILPQKADWADHAYHLYTIQLTGSMNGKRDQVFSDFKTNGIDIQVHYVPIHLMPLYQQENEGRTFPNAESYYKNCISLPIFPDLAIKDIDQIVEILKKSIELHQTANYQETSAIEPAQEIQEDKKQDFIKEPAVLSMEEESPSAQAPLLYEAPEEQVASEKSEPRNSPYRRRGRRKLESISKPSEPERSQDSVSTENQEEPRGKGPGVGADNSTKVADEKKSESAVDHSLPSETPAPKSRARKKTPARKSVGTQSKASDGKEAEKVKEDPKEDPKLDQKVGLDDKTSDTSAPKSSRKRPSSRKNTGSRQKSAQEEKPASRKKSVAEEVVASSTDGSEKTSGRTETKPKSEAKRTSKTRRTVKKKENDSSEE